MLLGTTWLGDITIAERMSWAAHRNTTRREDIAYSLLGIFDVNMPLIYGEGEKAFLRLQEEIIKRTNDLSIFAWDARGIKQPYCGVLADSPARFGNSSSLVLNVRWLPASEFAITNNGLRIRTHLIVPSNPPQRRRYPGYFLRLARGSAWGHGEFPLLGIFLKKDGLGRFVRISHPSLGFDMNKNDDIDWEESAKLQTFYLAVSTSSNHQRICAPGVSRSRRLHFPVHEVFHMRRIAPSASWDAFDRIFFFDSSILPCPGIACFSAVFEGDRKIEFGVLFDTYFKMGCSIFKCEDIRMDLEHLFQDPSDVLDVYGMVARVPKLRPFMNNPEQSVDYDFSSYKLRISVSIRREVIPSVSSESLPTVIIQASTRESKKEE
jgi:hypothetical protein